MRHWGNVKTKKEALRACAKVVRETGNTCVYDKAKCRNPGERSAHVCFRIWEDREDHSGAIIGNLEWGKRLQKRRGF